MMRLATQTGTVLGDWGDSGSYVLGESGRFLEKGEEYSTLMWDIVLDAFRHSNKLSAEIGAKESLHDFFRSQVVERIPDTEEGYERRREIVMQMSDMWGAFVGSPIARQSLKFFWLEECIEGGNFFVAGTYKKILEAIAEPALAGANIKLKKKAKRISYRMDPQDHVKVTLEDGQVLSFDDVVVTSPLGWLKRHLDAFEPPLPIRLTKAIRSIGYGCLEKVYITFSKAFWQVGEGQGEGGGGGDNEHKVRGFVQWLSPSYAPETNPRRWAQEVVELASLPSGAAHPTLLFYIYGEQSEHLTSEVVRGGPATTPEERDRALLDFFEPYYARLPGYSASSPDCRPTGCLATDWLHDDLAGNGSYSNFQVGLQEGDADIQTMRRGLPEKGLWLAGEHTAPFVALGTTTGAYWSGEAVGRRIADAYGMTR